MEGVALRDDLAPVALFVYRRPRHTRRCLSALARCPEFTRSQVFVFCDGPKNALDASAVNEVRTIVANVQHPQIHTIHSEYNKGLARSVIDGVTRLVEEFGRTIVVEDDLLVGDTFLTFMNRSLDKFAGNERVMQVAASEPPISRRGASEAFFLPITTSWGWGTWAQAWAKFDEKCSGWEEVVEDKVRRRQFNSYSKFDYANMLECQMAGEIDSWAIQWYWAVFKHHGLVLFPPNALLVNDGMDGSGTHTNRLKRLFKRRVSAPMGVCPTLPSIVSKFECTSRGSRLKWLLSRTNVSQW